MSTHDEAKDLSEKLEEISDWNLVNFFAEELQEINNGVKANSLFSSKAIQKLIRLNILESAQYKGKGNKSLTLTDKAHNLLESPHYLKCHKLVKHIMCLNR